MGLVFLQCVWNGIILNFKPGTEISVSKIIFIQPVWRRKQMSKKLYVVFAVLLVASMLLAACQPAAPAEEARCRGKSLQGVSGY